MSPTVLTMARVARARAVTLVSEPRGRPTCRRRLLLAGVNRRISDAAGGAGADRRLRRAAGGGDGAVRLAGPRPDVRHPRRGRRQAGRRHRGHRRAPDDRAPEHDHGVAARRPDARAGADAVDVGPRAAGAARPGLSAGQVQGRDRRGEQQRLQALRGQRRVRRARLPEVRPGGHGRDGQRSRARRRASCKTATPSTP